MGWQSGSDSNDVENFNMRKTANSLPLRNI